VVFTNLEKTDVVLIYGEARGRSELAWQIYGERFPQRILPNALTFVNVVQHLRNFGRFEMNKRDLGRQQQEKPRTKSCKLPGSSQFVVWLRIQNATEEIHQSRSILNRVRLS
jgi:hypothetical protein